MVIEDIELDIEIAKKAEKKEKEIKEKKKFIELTKEFNTESEKINCRFKIKYNGDDLYPHLYTIEKGFIFKEEKEYNAIFYYDENEICEKEIFFFSDGLDYNIFKEIEPVLNKLKQNFRIKLKNGKVPTKYGIIQELEK